MPTPSRSRVTVALGLGGNLGAVEATFIAALRALAAVLTELRVASLYRSRAVSPIPQPDFLNTAAIGATAIAPEALLAFSKRLEREAGRAEGPADSPRPLDIDLLVYDGLVQADSALTLPHPRLASRRFALAPLAEIASDLVVPPSGRRIGELLAAMGAPTPADAVELRAWSAGYPPV